MFSPTWFETDGEDDDSDMDFLDTDNEDFQSELYKPDARLSSASGSESDD